ncbi:hypothetical protein NQ318_017278 [Aromia moschata]|uniref:Uncharacterized protein n=1 Tax=Aromia moschata TaxID=1265417 RepID=A0AAV8XW41_9CUCU|nr:hypothetical protein NQ318_017278 [Aromia moschata]
MHHNTNHHESFLPTVYIGSPTNKASLPIQTPVSITEKMSGAVYQPTTVTYESNGPQERWQDRPISYLASTVTQTARRPCGLNCLPSRNFLPIILISSCIACFALGLVLLIHGALGYSETAENKEDIYLVVTIFGAIFFALSILLFVFFLRLTRRMCWRNVKDHMGTSGGQALTVNPSTDLLVTAQYAQSRRLLINQPNRRTQNRAS